MALSPWTWTSQKPAQKHMSADLPATRFTAPYGLRYARGRSACGIMFSYKEPDAGGATSSRHRGAKRGCHSQAAVYFVTTGLDDDR